MKKLIAVGLLSVILAGCATDSPCVPVYDDQGRLVHTNTCMKGTTLGNRWRHRRWGGGSCRSDAGYYRVDQITFRRRVSRFKSPASAGLFLWVICRQLIEVMAFILPAHR